MSPGFKQELVVGLHAGLGVCGLMLLFDDWFSKPGASDLHKMGAGRKTCRAKRSKQET